MNAEMVKGKWHQLKGRAKEQWGKLTDDDVEKIGGQSEQLLGVIQERYGYTKEKAQKEVDDWAKKCGC
ncbi:MAG: CsbD family protein [Candidatus Sumerlaeota bacterium]